MGIADQFKDKAQELADQAKKNVGDKKGGDTRQKSPQSDRAHDKAQGTTRGAARGGARSASPGAARGAAQGSRNRIDDQS
ncbi:hypothetical protein LRD69_12510 [Streptomyces sp. JH14]|uniref:hypothetical protein n=1 Tax=Streptomyces sp. JH14 TaxID=2793630 RepID=UPI0023F9AF07|nr:hypothetical protein [Streptomyces sp. JH14]MDF6042962.1 hypothetical protein [Streptomyces sp. JH14]